MKRTFDIILGFILLPILILPMGFISILIKIFSPGKIIYWSERVGIKNKIFLMPKFRTMKENAPELATDKLKNPYDYITNFGKFLRKTSLDELPQLLSVLKGDMSFVGPRPALYNQDDLIAFCYAKSPQILPCVESLCRFEPFRDQQRQSQLPRARRCLDPLKLTKTKEFLCV